MLIKESAYLEIIKIKELIDKQAIFIFEWIGLKTNRDLLWEERLDTSIVLSKKVGNLFLFIVCIMG